MIGVKYCTKILYQRKTKIFKLDNGLLVVQVEENKSPDIFPVIICAVNLSKPYHGPFGCENTPSFNHWDVCDRYDLYFMSVVAM